MNGTLKAEEIKRNRQVKRKFEFALKMVEKRSIISDFLRRGEFGFEIYLTSTDLFFVSTIESELMISFKLLQILIRTLFSFKYTPPFRIN